MCNIGHSNREWAFFNNCICSATCHKLVAGRVRVRFDGLSVDTDFCFAPVTRITRTTRNSYLYCIYYYLFPFRSMTHWSADLTDWPLSQTGHRNKMTLPWWYTGQANHLRCKWEMDKETVFIGNYFEGLFFYNFQNLTAEKTTLELFVKIHTFIYGLAGFPQK